MRLLWQVLTMLFVLVHPSAVQPGGPNASWLIEGTQYDAQRARGADYAILQTAVGEYRFDVCPGDRWRRDAEKKRAKERAELKSNSPVAFDVDYRVSYEMRIDTPLPVEGYIIAGQWHATEDPGDRPTSPPFSMEIWGSDLVAKTRSITERIYTGSPKTVERFRMKNITSGRWYKIAYDIRFSDATGKLVLWINRKQVYAGAIPIGFNDARGPYFKFGIYRNEAAERVVIRYRALSIRRLGPHAPEPSVAVLQADSGL